MTKSSGGRSIDRRLALIEAGLLPAMITDAQSARLYVNRIAAECLRRLKEPEALVELRKWAQAEVPEEWRPSDDALREVMDNAVIARRRS